MKVFLAAARAWLARRGAAPTRPVWRHVWSHWETSPLRRLETPSCVYCGELQTSANKDAPCPHRQTAEPIESDVPPTSEASPSA